MHCSAVCTVHKVMRTSCFQIGFVMRDIRHNGFEVFVKEFVLSPIVQWVSVGFDFLCIVFFFNCNTYRGLFEVNPKMTIFRFDLENEISVCSPVVIITLTEVFDITVPSKNSIFFSLKSLPQNRWYKSPYSLFS